MFTIVIILIVALIIVAIVINAIQQHKEQVEAERRAEAAKQKSIVDETEDVLMAAAQMPVSQQLILILNKRVLNALQSMYELNPKAMDIKQRVKDAQERVDAIKPEQLAPPTDNFMLPENDKQIIMLIQGIKKLRALLRSENSKGKVDTHVFLDEDKRLERLQLKVNVETLAKRARGAVQSNMLGSARQYFEKAIAALNAQPSPDEYVISKRQELEHQLQTIQDNLRNANAADRAKRKDAERDDLDELFAPKKKW
ncbi:flagellar motor control protein ZomB [Bowmanella denitrificans]|uniref:Flagellar motor control protein ZomB n=1 Tax=Bowmanella denitrificans TaxID=366582 RepID=A0ABN0XHC2_9ALTE